MPHKEDPSQQTPKSFPETTPLDLYDISDIRFVMRQVAKLEERVEHLDVRNEMRSDFRWTWSGIAAAFILLAGMLITAYFRIEDKAASSSTSLTRVETKVDDLIQRLSPILQPKR